MATTPLMEAIPLNGIDPDSAPKRRGRPPATAEQKAARNKADRDKRAQARSGAPSKAPRRRTSSARPTGPRSLRPEIGAALTMLNTVLIMSPLGTRPIEAMTDPAVIPTRIGDELDAAEIDALAASLDAQCRRSPRFRRYVESALTAGAGGQLVTVLTMIALRRAARHGMAPPALDMALGMALSSEGVGALVDMAQAPDDATETAPDPVTHEQAPDRNNGEVQYDFEGDAFIGGEA